MNTTRYVITYEVILDKTTQSKMTREIFMKTKEEAEELHFLFNLVKRDKEYEISYVHPLIKIVEPLQ